MRLVNARTLEFEDFWSEADVEYVILSHRWEDGEVSYQDMLSATASPTMGWKEKRGSVKIQRSCTQALNDGLNYVWCDTCCIDKTSSAELTEAINSMFRWYQRAVVCYAYLSDVTIDRASERVPESFPASVWFTRGWTLQELIAPKHVVFYDSNWDFLGTKQTLSPVISDVTGVDRAILMGESVFNRSIAQRMSWASNRITTRVEDKAYCLLGIFDVNMPMLYGEGEKAFFRLQEEIIRQSDDHSIFAWPKSSEDNPGLLASTPNAFAGCRHVRTVPSRKGRSAYSLTNRGLSIKLDATPWSTDTYLVSLYCVDELLHQDRETPIENYRMCMFLRRLKEDDQFARVKHGEQTFMQVESSVWDRKPNQTDRSSRPVDRIEINVRQMKRPSDDEDDYKDRINGFRICSPELLEQGKDGKDKFKVDGASWSAEAKIMSIPAGRFGTVGQLDVSAQEKKIKVIKLGFDFDFNPVCFIATSGGLVEKTPALDRQGKFNLGLDSQEAQWTADEKAQFAGIYQRSCFDELAWSVIASGFAAPLRQHSGLWAMKGDRVHGLSVKLQDYTSDTTTVEIKRGDFQGKLVWDVYIGNLRDTRLKSMKPALFTKNSSEAEVKSDEGIRKKSAFKLFKDK